MWGWIGSLPGSQLYWAMDSTPWTASVEPDEVENVTVEVSTSKRDKQLAFNVTDADTMRILAIIFGISTLLLLLCLAYMFFCRRRVIEEHRITSKSKASRTSFRRERSRIWINKMQISNNFFVSCFSSDSRILEQSKRPIVVGCIKVHWSVLARFVHASNGQHYHKCGLCEHHRVPGWRFLHPRAQWGPQQDRSMQDTFQWKSARGSPLTANIVHHLRSKHSILADLCWLSLASETKTILLQLCATSDADHRQRGSQCWPFP